MGQWKTPTYQYVGGWGGGGYSTTDEDTVTYAVIDISSRQWTPYITWNFDASSVSKVRSYCSSTYSNAKITVEVYYSGSWHVIVNEQVMTENGWQEHEIGSTEIATSMRLKMKNSSPFFSSMYVYEVDYYWVHTAHPLVNSSLTNSSPLIIGGLTR